MILPKELVDSMYKVHAHREGYSELMSRVARENQGYMPIALLQAAIANLLVDKNRQQSFSDFDSQKGPRRANPRQVTTTTEAKSPATKIECCYKKTYKDNYQPKRIFERYDSLVLCAMCMMCIVAHLCICFVSKSKLLNCIVQA
jgi:hypothetical protein